MSASIPIPDTCENDWDDESAIYRRVELPGPDPIAPDFVAPCQTAQCQTALCQTATCQQVSQVEMDAIFRNYRPYVAKIARRVLGSSGEVDDTIQDVFVATLLSVHSLRDPNRLKGWLATLTTRIARRKLHRSGRGFPQPIGDWDQLLELKSNAPSPESTAHLSSHIELFMALEEELRAPWLLRHVEGKTLEDIAGICNCSLSTAQRRIRSVDARLSRW